MTRKPPKYQEHRKRVSKSTFKNVIKLADIASNQFEHTQILLNQLILSPKSQQPGTKIASLSQKSGRVSFVLGLKTKPASLLSIKLEKPSKNQQVLSEKLEKSRCVCEFVNGSVFECRR